MQLLLSDVLFPYLILTLHKLLDIGSLIWRILLIELLVESSFVIHIQLVYLSLWVKRYVLCILMPLLALTFLLLLIDLLYMEPTVSAVNVLCIAFGVAIILFDALDALVGQVFQVLIH